MRAQRLLLQPAQEWAAIAGEFTNAGTIYWRFLAPMAAIGPIAATAGGIVFRERGSLLTFGTIPVGPGTAGQTGGVGDLLNLLGGYGLALAVDVIGGAIGAQRKLVPALKGPAHAGAPCTL